MNDKQIREFFDLIEVMNSRLKGIENSLDAIVEYLVGK
jgi:hypothetical protein